MAKKKKFLASGLVAMYGVLAINTASAAGKPDKNDFQNWDTVFLTLPVTDKFSTTLELQNRLQNNWHNESRFFVRPSLNYKLTPHLTLSQGYSWDPSFSAKDPSYTNENRIWEQLQYTHPLRDNFNLTLRTRVEERFIQVSASGKW
jgi:hypothetical protein